MISLRSFPEEAVSFVGALFSDPEVFRDSSAILGQKLGEVLLESPSLNWNHTGYYDRELQQPIFRKFIFFKRRIDPSSLARAKVLTVAIENEFLSGGKRTINLDPGYLTLAKVVLASRKNYSHRICIGRGVFAELELYYKDGDFHPMPYTYSDYQEEECRRIFREARELFKKSIKGRAQKKARAS